MRQCCFIDYRYVWNPYNDDELLVTSTYVSNSD